jgi:hypothetical protein
MADRYEDGEIIIDKQGMRFLNGALPSAVSLLTEDDAVSLAGTNLSDTLSIADTHVSMDDREFPPRTTRAGNNRSPALSSSKCDLQAEDTHVVVLKKLPRESRQLPRALYCLPLLILTRRVPHGADKRFSLCQQAGKAQTMMDQNDLREWVRFSLPGPKGPQSAFRHEWSRTRTPQEDLDAMCYGTHAGPLSFKPQQRSQQANTGPKEAAAEDSLRVPTKPPHLTANVDSS